MGNETCALRAQQPARLSTYRKPGLSSTFAAGARFQEPEVGCGPAQWSLRPTEGAAAADVREFSGTSATLQKTHTQLPAFSAERVIFQNAATGKGFFTTLSSALTDADQGGSPVHCTPAENFPLLKFILHVAW